MPAEALAEAVREQSHRLRVTLPFAPSDLKARLLSCRIGAWTRLLSGTEPTSPLDGRVELLAPVPVLSHLQQFQETHYAVRAGTPLARLHAAQSGRPGFDLLGRRHQAREPRKARLPRGRNTMLSDDGTVLYAACDGEVVLRNLMLHVFPMHVRDGDLEAADGVLASENGVFVRGSLRPGARIVASGHIYVAGDIHEAIVQSETGNISVSGSILGAVARPTLLQAGNNISITNVLYGTLSAGGGIWLLREARRSTLRAAGDLYLHNSLDASLRDVQIELGGGVVTKQAVAVTQLAMLTERQHFRVSMAVQAAIALHGVQPLRFHPCWILDVSSSGARCRVTEHALIDHLVPNTAVQLKFALPDRRDLVLVIARVARLIAPGVIGVEFVHMTQHDHQHLADLCVRSMLRRAHVGLPRSDDRGR